MDGDPPGLDPVTEDPADRGRPPRPVAPPKKPLADFLLEFEARLRLAPEQPATDSIAALEARAEGTRDRPAPAPIPAPSAPPEAAAGEPEAPPPAEAPAGTIHLRRRPRTRRHRHR